MKDAAALLHDAAYRARLLLAKEIVALSRNLRNVSVLRRALRVRRTRSA